MKEVNIDVLKNVANSLMFDMSEDEYRLLEGEFHTTLKQMDLIHNIKGVEDVTPMTFPYEVTTSALREDEPSEVISSDEALKNAKDVIEKQIRIPRVLK
ncbi:MAG: Asp-tRNA(Asn)/Glu-tRNA(Gln) amidotransferase GatCAB subunit C [Coprobacillus sp.]|nr:Asp-tRNA(Asn)/Glu-tRNA(Gln) amidotransferase GatCAB subunit C [Coprobacillus sp.]